MTRKREARFRRWYNRMRREMRWRFRRLPTLHYYASSRTGNIIWTRSRVGLAPPT